MAKRKKRAARKKKAAPHDMTRDEFLQLVVQETRCYDAEGEPRIAVLNIYAVGGLQQFILTQEKAEEMIQELRDFLAEDAERLP